jgi:hypothetical protein
VRAAGAIGYRSLAKTVSHVLEGPPIPGAEFVELESQRTASLPV